VWQFNRDEWHAAFSLSLSLFFPLPPSTSGDFPVGANLIADEPPRGRGRRYAAANLNRKRKRKKKKKRKEKKRKAEKHNKHAFACESEASAGRLPKLPLF
jgi:hypothetical protein